MAGLIDSFGRLYTFKRYSAPVMVHGQAQQPVEVLNNGLPWKMMASIQPISGFQVLALPEGMRNKELLKVYTTTSLQMADESSGTIGDRFTWNGRLYEIISKFNWADTDLTHYKFVAAKVEHT